MSGKAFQSKDETARMKRPEQRWSADPGLDITGTLEVQAMPENTGRIPQSDSASNPHNHDNWKSIGTLAARLVEKAKVGAS